MRRHHPRRLRYRHPNFPFRAGAISHPQQCETEQAMQRWLQIDQ